MSRVRNDLYQVANRIPLGSHVLDLGCGEGELLRWLFTNRACSGTGVEHEPGSVLKAMESGVPVLDLDIDTQLDLFAPDSYDYVVLSRTLQAIRRPDIALKQMRKIAPRLIVTMPNFGFWRNRTRLLSGHMPQSKDLPFNWYETPNLHHSTLVDMPPLFGVAQLRVAGRVPLAESGKILPLGSVFPNLRAGSAIYVLERIGS
ncbi:methionine biosynthesis protein MetW [Propionimicrobium lymphophilum]|uniref:methionine biosynthesis protein MetW n=1 Tax=Propionimicrobium lymphophilum TaxID=33012 RepID=UPI003EC7312E